MHLSARTCVKTQTLSENLDHWFPLNLTVASKNRPLCDIHVFQRMAAAKSKAVIQFFGKEATHLA